MRYFKVIAKCGHVGRNNYILKVFYQSATDGKEAAKIVRNLPRVKHNHKDAIRGVVEITQDEFFQGRKIMSEDPYFNVHNKQSQNLLCPDIMYSAYKEDSNEMYEKRGMFKHVRYLVLLKEIQKDMRGGYFYE